MNGRDLDRILKSNRVTKRQYIGTFPASIFPESGRDSYSFISNTQEHNKKGDHWVGWFIRDRTVTFMDTFGRAPDDETFPDYFSDFIDKFDNVEFSRVQIQSISSQLCGYFCIQFVYIMSLGLEIDAFIKEYTTDTLLNDILVHDFIQSIS